MKLEEYERSFNLESTYWWFVGTRLLYFDLIRQTIREDYPERNILDIGCGTGGITRDLEKIGRVFGMDKEQIAIEFCKKRQIQNLIIGDSNYLPFRNSSFDVICAFNIIEHLDDGSGFLDEIYRTSKSNTKIFLSTSAFKFLWSSHDIASKHKRRYAKISLKQMVEDKFKVKKITYTNFFLFPLIFLIIFLKKIISWQNYNVSRSFYYTPKIINLYLAGLLRLEAFFLRCFNFPFGVSLFCILEKR